MITDRGENDPIEFDLGAWECVAKMAKKEIEDKMFRKLRDVTSEDFKDNVI
jgi:hypothetical protein